MLQRDAGSLPARHNHALVMARRGCGTSTLQVLETARAEADNGPYAAAIADSLRAIQALAAPAAPPSSCP